ncbi:MAG: hypothetical protein RR958_26195, partial [Pseudomonas sp.]
TSFFSEIESAMVHASHQISCGSEPAREADNSVHQMNRVIVLREQARSHREFCVHFTSGGVVKV